MKQARGCVGGRGLTTAGPAPNQNSIVPACLLASLNAVAAVQAAAAGQHTWRAPRS